jgi:hypothetical protein
LPNGSPTYQKRYYDALSTRYDAQFEADLGNSLNAIQQDPKLDANAKQQLMQQSLAGKLKGAPLEFKAKWESYGSNQIMQRSQLLVAQQAAEQEKLVIADLTAIRDRQVDELISIAASGSPTVDAHKKVVQTIDRLRDLKAIGPEAAEVQKKLLGETAYGTALLRRATEDILGGKNDPEAVMDFAIKLDAGGDAEINVTAIQPRRDGVLAPELHTLKTKDVLKRIADPQLRKSISVQLKEAATQFKSELAQYSKGIELNTWFDTQSGKPDRALPAHLVDDFDKAIGTRIQSGALSNPEERGRVLELVVRAKRVPDSLVKSLSLELHGNEKQFEQAALTLHMLRTAKTPDGSPIGHHIIQTVPEDLRDLASAISHGLEFGHPLAEIKQSINNTGNANRISIVEAIDHFNATKTLPGSKFTAKAKQDFYAKTGIQLPPEAEAEVKRSFHLHFLASRNADAAYTKAVESVADSYVKSNIFLHGYAKTHQLDLTNPPGFKSDKWFKTGYEWLNQEITKTLSGVASNIPGVDLAAITAGEPLGKTVFLKATDTKLERPQFEVWARTQNGDLIQVHEKTSSGDRPLIVDPGSDHAVIQHKHTVLESADAIKAGADKQIKELRARLDGPFSPIMVGKPVTQEMIDKYKLDVDQIEERYKKAITDYEKKTGTEVPEKELDRKDIMLQPRAAGESLVKQVVQYIDELLPDGTGGAFLGRIAATESDFGRAGGTYRPRGDKGIWQINTGSAFVEVKRLIKQGKGKVFEAYQHIKRETGIDLSQATEDDLDKPLISGLFARLYFERRGREIPKDIPGQARLWKDYYNTYLGAGKPEHFVSKAMKNTAMFASSAGKKPAYEMTWDEIYNELTDKEEWAKMYEDSVMKGIFDALIPPEAKGKKYHGEAKESFEGLLQILEEDYGMKVNHEQLAKAPLPTGAVYDIRDTKSHSWAAETMISLINYALTKDELAMMDNERKGGVPLPRRKPADIALVRNFAEFVRKQQAERDEIGALIEKTVKPRKPLKVNIPGKKK